MMKKIALGITALMAALVMTGCEVSVEAKDNTHKVEDYINMIKVCSNMFEQVSYDNNTGVMYYQYRYGKSECGLTPIYNADGTLKIYEGWSNNAT
jgi:hypothetical protein